MYRYDDIDRDMLADRSAEFREQVDRRLAGDLSEDQFKPLRLMNGLYLQLHAYMLRVAIPYGSLNPTQLRKLAWIARTYDKGYGHFTTRQNLQLHWIKLADTPDILDHLASVDMHAIQTSGNCIRNITADPHAGATTEEIDDPRVWAEAIVSAMQVSQSNAGEGLPTAAVQRSPCLTGRPRTFSRNPLLAGRPFTAASA